MKVGYDNVVDSPPKLIAYRIPVPLSDCKTNVYLIIRAHILINPENLVNVCVILANKMMMMMMMSVLCVLG